MGALQKDMGTTESAEILPSIVPIIGPRKVPSVNYDVRILYHVVVVLYKYLIHFPYILEGPVTILYDGRKAIMLISRKPVSHSLVPYPK
jgi:hypothetical protein